VAQFEFEDGFGLGLGEPETLDQNRLGMVVVADDGDDFVEVQVGDQQPGQDVQAV